MRIKRLLNLFLNLTCAFVMLLGCAEPAVAATQNKTFLLKKEDFYFCDTRGNIKHSEIDGLMNCINYVDLIERSSTTNHTFKEFDTNPGTIKGNYGSYSGTSLYLRAPVKLGSSESQVLSTYGKTQVHVYHQYKYTDYGPVEEPNSCDYLVYAYSKPRQDVSDGSRHNQIYYQVFIFNDNKKLATIYWDNEEGTTPSNPVRDIEMRVRV